MDATYSVTIDPRRGLLHIELGGFFSLTDVEALEAEKRAALSRLGLPRNTHLTLVDVSRCKLQAQDVFRAFQSAIADTRYMARRLAFVTGSSLARMQIRRMTTRDDAKFFATIAEAEAWLFEPAAAIQRTGTG
jgi:hypothetical protein